MTSGSSLSRSHSYGIAERVAVVGPLDRAAVGAGGGVVSGETFSHGHGA